MIASLATAVGVAGCQLLVRVGADQLPIPVVDAGVDVPRDSLLADDASEASDVAGPSDSADDITDVAPIFDAELDAGDATSD